MRGKQQPLRLLQRNIVSRVVYAYRTVSFDAACLLARIFPLPILAVCRAKTFHRIAELKANNEWTLDTVKAVSEEENVRLRDSWVVRLRNEFMPGIRTRTAILPSLDLWLNRSW